MKTKELTEAKKFIIKTFGELYANGAVAIRTAVFFEKAKKTGVYNGGYGEPINHALAELAKVEIVDSDDGKFKYKIFKLKGIS